MPPILLFFVALVLQRPIVEPPVTIDLVFTGTHISPGVEDLATREAASIWAPYGVDLRATSLHDAEPDNRVVVILAEHQEPGMSSMALGSVRFRGSRPEPTVFLYPHAVDALVAETPIVHPERDCSPAVHELHVGRALGRALAHEIGHFLLRSRYHAPTGLMRARHRSPELIGAEREAFELSTAEIARIRLNASASD